MSNKYKSKRQQEIIEQVKQGTFKSNQEIRMERRNANLRKQQAEADIAPVKTADEDKKWYQKILKGSDAFDDMLAPIKDGYNFGDVTKIGFKSAGATVKTILGTGADIGLGAVKGVAQTGEGIGKLIAGGVAQIADETGNDKFANKVRKNLATKEAPVSSFLGDLQDKVSGSSIIGDTGDKVSEAIGYIGSIWASGGAGTATMFTSGTGNALEETYKKAEKEGENVEDWQVWTKSLGTGLIETATERLFGIFGTSGLDKGVANAISAKITSGAGKVLSRLGVQATGEAVEEFLSYAGSQGLDYMIDVANTATGGNGMDFKEDWNWEEVGEQMAVAFMASGVLGGGGSASSIVSNMNQGNLSLNEAVNETARQQDVQAQSENLSNEIKKLEKKIKKTTDAEAKAQLQEELNWKVKQFNALQGNNEQQAVEQIPTAEDIQVQIAGKEAELNATEDIREQEIIRDEINILQEELAPLQESLVDPKQKSFTYETNEKDSDYKKTVYESASQVMNDTEETHKFVDAVAKISEEKQTSYKFVNNEQLKELGYKVKKGTTINGLVSEEGEVLINVDSKKYLNVVLGHETTHLLEGTKEYEDLKAMAIKYAKTTGDYQSRIDSLNSLYEGKNADIEAELTADIVGDYLFTNEQFLQELSVQKPTIFQKIKNLISDLVVKFKGTEQEKQLRELQRKFEKAYRTENTQTSENSIDVTETISNKDDKGRTLSKKQQEYFKESVARDKNGNLLTMYHGTRGEFYTFEKNRAGQNYEGNWSSLGKGFYFSTDYESAKDYGASSVNEGETIVKEVYLDIKHPFDAYGDYRQEFSDLKEKYNLDDEILSKGFRLIEVLNRDGHDSTAILQEKGYDGIIQDDEYVVFESNQIKNIDNENPTTNPDTRYSLSADIDNKGKKLSEEQKEYFKNSKVVDENGKLIEVYHGTGTTINEFKPEFTGRGNDQYGSGFYFTTDKSEAEMYQSTINTNTTEKVGGTDNPNVIASYLNIQKPIIADGMNLANSNVDLSYEETLEIIKQSPILLDIDETPIGSWFDVWSEGVQDYMIEEVANNYVGNLMSLENDFFSENATAFREAVYKATGYDGVVHEFKDGRKHYIAWFPNQIKSVNNQKPTTNPDIRYSLSEEQEIPLNERLSGDDLLNAEDLIYEIEDIAEISPNGYVTLYHRTSQENANEIYRTGKMSAKEDGVFFSTKNEDSQATGFGEAVVKVKVPVEKLVLDDLFNDEAHLKIPLKSKNEVLDVSQYLVKDDFSLSNENEEIAPTGDYQVRGEDVKLQIQEAIAPLQETIEALTEKIETIAPTNNNTLEKYLNTPTSEIIEDFDYAQHIEDIKIPVYNEVMNIIENNKSDNQKLLKALQEEYNKNELSEGNKNVERYTGRTEDLRVQYSTKESFLHSLITNLRRYGTIENEPLYQVLKTEKIENIAPVQDVKTEINKNGVQMSVGEKIRTFNNSIYEVTDFFTTDDGVVRAKLRNDKGYETSIGIDSIDENLTDPTKNNVSTRIENDSLQSSESVEKQNTEAFNNLTDDDAPIKTTSFEDSLDDIFNEMGSTGEKVMESPLKDRNIDDVGNKKVKAYQFENPEVRPYFQAEAENMLYDLDNTIKGERIAIKDEAGYITDWAGITRQTTEAIAYLKDKYGYSYDQIRTGLNKIIEDDGAENNAVSKRIEFMLDERLREGYTTSDGIPIPANEDYIKFLEEKQIMEYNKENFDAITDEDAPIEEIAPVESVAPSVTNENAPKIKNELKVDESLVPTQKVAEKTNTELIDSLEEAEQEEHAKIAKVLTERPTAENRDQRIWAKFRASFLDKGSVVEDLSLKTKNRELMAKWDNLMLAQGKAQHTIHHGMQRSNADTKVMEQASKSLDSMRERVVNSGKLQEFGDYMYHYLNVDRMSLEANAQVKMAELQANDLKDFTPEEIAKLSRKRITDKVDDATANLINKAKEYMTLSEVKNKPVFGDSVTAEQSRQMVEELEFSNPEFAEWANDIYEYNRALRDVLVENGVISQETADYFETIYPHYVPIKRVDANGKAINVPLDTNRTGINTPIKRATGGDSNIEPLFDTLASRTLQTYRASTRNSFGTELKKALNSNGISETASVESVMDSVDDQESLLQEGQHGQAPTFTVFENGKKVTFEITQDMYEALKPLSESSFFSTTYKPLNAWSNFKRGVLTQYNPLFSLTNSIKDFQDVLINSQHPAKTYAKFGEAYAQILNKGYWYQEYMANGGEQNSYFDSQDGFDHKVKGIERVTELFPLKAISAVNDVIETAPRLAEYIASRETGRSIEVSMLDASRVTTNFKAGGDVTKWANRNGFTFLNASIQGLNQNIRNVREAHAQGVRGYLNLATKFAIAGLPALLLNGLLWDDDEEYEELADYVKQNYYVVAKTEDGDFIRIPKGRMSAVLQEGANQMANLITGNDEADLKTFLKLVSDNLAPNNPITNNVLAPFAQVAMNKAWHGDEIVSSSLQDLPEEEQYDESTDKFSIWLGEQIGVSPKKINYLLDQNLGGIGDVLLPMGTPKAESSTENKLLAPFVNKFTTNSTLNNQDITDFYDTSEDLTVKANSSKATDDDVLKNKYINSIKGEMNEFYKQKREIQADETIPDTEKYEMVKDIQEQINQLAKTGLSNYENIYKTDTYAQIGDREYYKYTNKEGEEEWRKVDEDELEEINNLGMNLNTKTTYFNLKTRISKIMDIDKDIKPSEEKRAEIATMVRDSGLTDEQKAYIYGKNYSSDKTLNMIVKSGIPFNEYLNYASQTIEADKKSNGDSISGSRKKKVISYINSLNLTIPQKAMLIRKEYSSFKEYNNDIVNYVNDLDLSITEKKSILEELDFEVKDNGTVTWK